MDGVSDRPWSEVKPSDYRTAAEYCSACLVDETPLGEPQRKDRCKLPVYEPESMGGRLNRKAVHAAAERLVQRGNPMHLPDPVRAALAEHMLDLYARMEESPPPSITRLAHKGYQVEIS